MEIFARPAVVLDTGADEIAHAELYVPLSSDRKARLISMTVSGSTEFSILGRGGEILSGASFPESRGLPIRDGSPRQYSRAHARTKRTREVNPDGSIAYVEGGMWMMVRNPSGGPVHIGGADLPVLLGCGNGLLVRNTKKGEKLLVNFVWREVA